MDELTERKRQILRAVVLEYVESAEPVGSGLIVERYQLGIGPATVRHELAEMSERGFLEQPHTSAGRIPSDVGYRYFVDRLAEPAAAPDAQRRVRELSKSEQDLQELLQETCKVLSRLTEYVSIAVTTGDRSLTVRGGTVSGLTKDRVLLSVLLSNGLVENRILPAPGDLTLSELHDVSLAINQHATGVKLRPLARMAQPDAPHLTRRAGELLGASWKAVKNICRAISTGRVVTEGTHHLFRQPEFADDVQTLAQAISALEDYEALQGITEQTEQPTTIAIGRENPREALQSLTVMMSKFYIADEEAGIIGIAGPTRMRYAATIPLVETAAKAVSEALARLMR